MKKRRLKKKVKFTLALLIIGITLIYGFIFLKNNPKSINFIKEFLMKENNSIKNDKPKIPKEVWPKVEKISLVATGDALLHNSVYIDAYNKKTDTFNFAPQVEMIKDIVSKYDIAYYNQETIFGGKQPDIFPNENQWNVKGYHCYPHFNSPSEFGDAMVDIGFNMVSLASNHSADCKTKTKDCVTNAYKYWESKNVVFDGLNIEETRENKYNINTINGITYGFLNYTTTLNGLDGFVKGQEYLIDTYSEEISDQEIIELKKKVDVLIVAMHWHKNSPEYSTVPSNYNKQLAMHLSELGVDIILGTYSHCLQPFDIINEGKTVVFYSLGNFISNQGVLTYLNNKGIVGVLAGMDIVKTTNKDKTFTIKVENLRGDLIYTYNNGNIFGSDAFKVIPFDKMNETYNKNYRAIYEEFKNILTSLNSNIDITPIN